MSVLFLIANKKRDKSSRILLLNNNKFHGYSLEKISLLFAYVFLKSFYDLKDFFWETKNDP
jgi:hypothetical protein